MGARTVMIFAGPAVTLPLVLTYAGRGGQVILSETAWESVKSTVVHHPGAVRIISLGTHIVSADFPQPMLLMEVMPNLLSKRVFQSLLTKQLVEPGYRDAPDPKNPMAIVFVKVCAAWLQSLTGAVVSGCIDTITCSSPDCMLTCMHTCHTCSLHTWCHQLQGRVVMTCSACCR